MKAKVLIALNCSLAPEPQSIVSLRQAQEYGIAQGVQSALLFSKMFIQGFLAGGAFAKVVLDDPTYTHLILVSDDLNYPKDFLVRLVADDVDVVSGIYRLRDPSKNTLAVYVNEQDKVLEYFKSDALVESDYASGHTMLIKRQVLEGVAANHPELVYINDTGERTCAMFIPFVKNNKLFLDDWAFSTRVREAGFKCYIDFGVKLLHKCDIWLEPSDGTNVQN